MSEYEQSLPASDDPEWVALVLDVENRFESLNDALADLRSAVIRLSSYRPQPQVIHESAVAQTQATEPVEPTEPTEPTEAQAALEDAVAAFEAAVVVTETQAEPEPELATAESNGTSPEPPPEDDEARREEVRRMVAEARHEPAAPPAMDGSWAAPHDDSEVDSTSEGSWPVARPAGLQSTPPARRPQDDPAFANTGDESRRDEVARMVAEMRAGMAEEPMAVAEPDTEASDESRRDEVARMVAEMRSKMTAETEGDDATAAEETDDEARREDVAETVARMRAEAASGASLDGQADQAGEATSPADDSDVRDEVRKAVEAARAEMASGWVKDEAGAPGVDTAEKPKFSFPDWQTTRMEPSGPPVIVIKDPEGRVELARVYETLSQVNCDENAALLNYTPHSVTVGLNMRAAVPTKEAMEKAIETVFGRKCRVDSDGVRVSVDIGATKEDAA